MVTDAELWQVDKGRQARLDAGLAERGETTVSERIGWLVGAGVLRIPTVEVVLVPDSRSQAIADAWNNGSSSQREALKDWPELYDALTEDENTSDGLFTTDE